jgi:L-threonylcarbamoyladenylate synthase
MKFLPVSTESLELAAGILRSGGLVAFPTETVYGLGADAFNPEALAKVFEAKGRPRFDPLIVHIAAIEDLEKTADLSLLSAGARKKLFLLAEKFWPGPLSIILPKNEKIPGIATAGLSTAAIRLPDHEAARKLISLSGTAVAAPSANPFGSISPTRAEHVRDKLGEKVDLILDGGPTRIGLESTVLDIAGNFIKILRPGGTPKGEIEKLVGSVYGTDENELCSHAPVSPGQLKSHYAPKTPLSVFTREAIVGKPYEAACAFLFFDGSTRDAWLKAQGQRHDSPVIKVLSETGQVLEAAARLFETLHELDSLGISQIFAQLAPPEGLGEAINDRLTRAHGATSIANRQNK